MSLQRLLEFGSAGFRAGWLPSLRGLDDRGYVLSARVAFRTPGGQSVSLVHGDFIGRLSSAALVLDDPRVSEAHALVSLRGDGLYLLGLRRPVRMRGKALTSILLESGQSIEFADDLALVVEAVTLPDVVAAIEGDDLAKQPLPPVASLWTRPRSRISGKFEPEAPAHLWSLDDAWRLRAGGRSRIVAIGDTFDIDGRTYRLTELSLNKAAGKQTIQSGGVDAPLRIITRYDTVHLQREGYPTVLLTGGAARLLSELGGVGCAMRWEELCSVLWPRDQARPSQLRHRLDMSLLRLRRRLKAERVREDLVQAGGAGLIELVLREDDVLVDEN